MIKRIVTLLILCISINLIAQKDTLYFKLDNVFHTNWISCTKSEAEFYRPLPLKKVGKLYKIKDYYINSSIYMEGFTTDPNKTKYTGNIIWYYKNGNKLKEANYKNLELNGLVKTYFENGVIKTEGTYKKGKAIHGTFFSCHPCYIIEKKDEKIIAEHQFYKNSNIIAEKSFKNEDEHTIRRIAFDKNGKKIAEVTIEPINTYIDGKVVLFDIDNNKNITNIIGISNYKNKKLQGESIDYDSNGNTLAKGIYQNGLPYSGTFYNYNINAIRTYKNGVLEGKETTYSKSEIIAQGINKSGYHWNGQFKSGDYEILTVKDGALNGKQTTYYTGTDFQLTNIKSYHHITNDLKEGESAYFNKEGKQIAKGIYKNNKPWQGTFYDDYYSARTSFKKGKKHGLFVYYDFSGKIKAKQQYKDGKKHGFYTGYNFSGSIVVKQEYQNGELIR